MVKLACFSKNDPEPLLIVLKLLVFLVAAACVASDVLFFMRSTPENYGLLIWRLPLESAVCLTYLLSLLNQGWHRIRHKHKTIGKRRLLWMAPVIIALVALVVADMIREMSRIVRWREDHGNVQGLSVMAADGDGSSNSNGGGGNVRPDPAAANENAVTQFWTCALTNEFYKTASTATKIQHGPESNVGGWTGYCVPRNFGWCGGLALAVVFLADVTYSYAKRHQLQAKNEMAMKREQEEQECHSSSGSNSSRSSSHGGRRKEAEAHALTNVTSAHSRTADNLLA